MTNADKPACSQNAHDRPQDSIAETEVATIQLITANKHVWNQSQKKTRGELDPTEKKRRRKKRKGLLPEMAALVSLLIAQTREDMIHLINAVKHAERTMKSTSTRGRGLTLMTVMIQIPGQLRTILHLAMREPTPTLATILVSLPTAETETILTILPDLILVVMLEQIQMPETMAVTTEMMTAATAAMTTVIPTKVIPMKEKEILTIEILTTAAAMIETAVTTVATQMPDRTLTLTLVIQPIRLQMTEPIQIVEAEWVESIKN